MTSRWTIGPLSSGATSTRMSKGVAFGVDSGTVALALATGEGDNAVPDP